MIGEGRVLIRHRSSGRAVAVLAAAAVILTGCTTVLDGHAETGRSTQTGGSPTGFPAGAPTSPARTTGAPTNAPTSPQRTSPQRTSPGSRDGVLVTYPAGHFRARFPQQPTERSQPGSIGGASFEVHVAATSGTEPVLAEEEDVSVSIPRAQYGLTLHAALSSFAGAAQMTLGTQQDTTFQNHVAARASVTRDSTGGSEFTLLAFMYSGSRVYVLFAPAGSGFDAFAASFVTLA